MIGSVCVKIAGRDAGKECIIVDTISKHEVLIDGNTRRRKCNLKHLQFIGKKVELRKGASSEEVKKALESLKITIEKKAPAKIKKTRQEAQEAQKVKKPEVKKEKKGFKLFGKKEDKGKKEKKPKEKKVAKKKTEKKEG